MGNWPKNSNHVIIVKKKYLKLPKLEALDKVSCLRQTFVLSPKSFSPTNKGIM